MELREVYSKMFGWMFLGLLVTFLTGYVVSNSYDILLLVAQVPFIVYAIIEIGLVIFFSLKIRTMSSTTAKICFLLYSFVTGLTFSFLFLVYELYSMIYVFGITALLFGIFALIGYFTKIDLSKFSTFLFMGLFAIVICSLINMFIGNETFDLILTIIGIIIFLGYTAYDIQKVKYNLDTFPQDNLAIYGALELYLDFINLFLKLLSLFGKRKN